MNIVLRYAITIFLFPGGVFALFAGWALLWLGEEAGARLHGTRRTAFIQPMRDVVKLLGKTTSLPSGAEGSAVRLLPLLAVVAPLLALALTTLPGNLAADMAETSGDLLAVLLLLLLPALMPLFLGELLASPYGHIAARRATWRAGALISLLLLSALTVAAQRGSLSLSILTLQQLHPPAVSIVLNALAGLLFLLCVPALLPPAKWGLFSGPLELVAGPFTDLTGADLALMQLGAALQRVAAGSVLAALFILPYVPGGPIAQIPVYLATLLLSSLFAGFASGVSRRYSFAR